MTVDNDKIFQRQGEVFTSDVREVKVVFAAGMLDYHQSLELIDVGHIVALCRERERERERGGRGSGRGNSNKNDLALVLSLDEDQWREFWQG